MKVISVRKLAALDMSFNGAWLIVAEFVAGALGGFALAYVMALPPLFFWWLVGVACNYVPLALYAIVFALRGGYKETAEDVLQDKRAYNTQQLLVLVPFVLAAIAFVQAAARRS